MDDLRALVDFGVDAAVEDEGNHEGLDVGLGNVELGGDVRDRDSGVRLDESQEDLGADVLQEILDVIANEVVAHDLLAMRLEELLECRDIVSLIRANERSHDGDFFILAKRFHLLRVERVDFALHEHVCQNQIFQALYASIATGFVVRFERFEKIRRRVFPVALYHVHLPTALSNNA